MHTRLAILYLSQSISKIVTQLSHTNIVVRTKLATCPFRSECVGDCIQNK